MSNNYVKEYDLVNKSTYCRDLLLIANLIKQTQVVDDETALYKAADFIEEYREATRDW